MFKPTLHVVCCFILCLALAFVSVRAALTFTPAAPLVETGGEIHLRTEGAVEPVIWTAAKGQINGSFQGMGTIITYAAPAEADIAAITVRDAANQMETLTVTVLPPDDIADFYAPENVRSEVSSHRSHRIIALLLSADGATLWAGAKSGLEKRDWATGRLLRVYTRMDGLPSDAVTVFALDGAGGLWIGTPGGLARLGANGTWTVYHAGYKHWDSETDERVMDTPANSGLPSNDIRSLAVDGAGGLWIGTYSDGLARLGADGTWTVYHVDYKHSVLPGEDVIDTPANSGLLSNDVRSLAADGAGGLWIGTSSGLVRLDADGIWTVYHAGYRHWNSETGKYIDIPANSGLPSNDVRSLAADGTGGLWIGTSSDLARLDTDGTWTVYHAGYRHWDSETDEFIDIPANSGMLSNNVRSLAVDGAGGLWTNTSYGPARLGADGIWTVYHNMLWDLETAKTAKTAKYVSGNLAVDNAGGVWIGTSDGDLARLGADKAWMIYERRSSGLPPDSVLSGHGGLPTIYHSLASDGSGGLWFSARSTYRNYITPSSLGRLNADGRLNTDWISSYSQPGSAYYSNPLTRYPFGDIASDGAGGLWMIDAGLNRLGADGSWTRYDKIDKDVSRLAVDGAGGLWVSGGSSGLNRLGADGTWTVYDQSNSGLPDNRILSIAVDGKGGLWAGTDGSGLARLGADGTWTVYNESNSDLPDNVITSLAVDGAGELWAGTDAGLTRLGADGTWTMVYDQIVSTLVVNRVGGVWANTEFGVAGLGADGIRTVYDQSNSALTNNYILALVEDAGGLWAGTFDNLARFSFGGDRMRLFRQTGNSALFTDKRAAIVIHPQGSELTVRDTSSIAFMAAHACRSLKARGYTDDEIYFISAMPDMDIDGDGHPDDVTDAPVKLAEFRAGAPRRDLTMADLRAAFDWAAQQGTLDQPLLVIFIGHGEPERLLLDAHGAALTAPELDALLDSYQENSGSQAAVILEAGHSGTFIPGLSGDNRLIITSADSKRAYYDDLGALSFTRLYFDKLRDMNKNRSFSEAFRETSAEFSGADSIFRRQRPLLDDNGDGAANSLDGALADNWCLNGCIGGLSGAADEMTLAPETPAQTVMPDQKITLAARAVITGSHIRSVRAVILTPEAEALRSARGFSLIPPVSMPLTRDPADPERWSGTFSGFTYRGSYVVKFLAEDRDGFLGPYASVTLAQEQGPEVPVAPVPNLKTLRDGNILRVNLPFTQDKHVYASIAAPDGRLYMLDDFNSFHLFDGSLRLPRWNGAGTLLEFYIAPWMPRGEYHLYMLRRLPAETEPQSNMVQWQLEASSFIVEQSEL